jgi:NADH dehydrogenase [ubiquinone] 1 alpha subcomplex assembly factor 7
MASKNLKSVHLVETSGSMRTLQSEKLRNAKEAGGFELLWHDAIDDVPHREDTYTMLVAHEFFDALPVHVLEVRIVSIMRCGLIFLGIENSSRVA